MGGNHRADPNSTAKPRPRLLAGLGTDHDVAGWEGGVDWKA